MNLKHPECDRDGTECQIQISSGMATCMAWWPTYDGNGRRTDKGDPNIYTQDVHCYTCKRRWVRRTQFGETTIIPDQRP